MKTLLIWCCLMVAGIGLRAVETGGLQAEFLGHERFTVYQPGETVKVKISLKGDFAGTDHLEYYVGDYREQPVGTVVTLATDAVKLRQGVEITLPQLPAGGYFLHAKLTANKITFPWQTSQPAGYAAFGILPAIKPLPLQYADQSRFGAQGTNFIVSGVFMRGDYLAPLYPALGLHWSYAGRKLLELEKNRNEFVPATQEKLRQSGPPCEANNNVAVVTDLHGVPTWMLRCPEYVNLKDKATQNSVFGQSFPVKELDYYTDLVGRVAKQQKAWREMYMPHMQRNYYQLHWEPDWHWNGTEDEFIAIYRAAAQGIRKNDPTASLLGCNYGVIAINNKKIKRLFDKGLGQYLNGVLVHLYYLPLDQDPESARIDLECRALRQMTDKYVGKDALLMNTEWGQDYHVKYPDLTHNILMTHLARFVRGHLIALGEGFSATWFFYTADYGGYYNAGGEDGYGMCFNLSDHMFGATKIAPKPTFMAAAAMTRLLEGTKTLGRLDYFGQGIYAYAFRRGNDYLLTAWSVNGDKTITLETGTDNVTVYDIMGVAAPQKCPDRKTTVKLSRFPIYILGLGVNAVPNAVKDADSVFRTAAIDAVGGKSLQQELRRSSAGLKFEISSGDSKVALSAPELTLPENLAAGCWRLTAYDARGELADTMLVTVSGTAGVKDLAVAPDRNGHQTMNIKIENRLARPQDLTAQITLGGVAVKTIEINAAAPGETVLTVPINELKWDQGATKPLSVALNNVSGVQDRKEIYWGGDEMKLFTPPIADGAAGWPADGFSRIFGKEFISYKADLWKGSTDLECRYQLAADKHGLAVAVEVKDQVAFRGADVRVPWRSDAVIVAVGSDADANCEWGKIRRFSVTMKNDGTALLQEIFGTPPKGVVEPKNTTVKVTLSRDDRTGITFYSFTIPWREIGDPPTIARDGAIGVGITVDDADSAPEVIKDQHRELSMRGGIPLFMGGTRLAPAYLPRGIFNSGK